MEDKNREQILNNFSKNVLIEAGAGSGKTTILVNRILNQVKKTDITLDKIVAITFTEKAATGLQERFQEHLFKAHASENGIEKKKLKKAIEDMDKIHISTIHSFCSSMLKEMPFEAGLSLDFTIVQDQDDENLKKRLFARFCDGDIASNNPEIEAIKLKLGEVSINPEILGDTFMAVCEKDGITWVYDQDMLKNISRDFFAEAKKILKQITRVLNRQDDPSTGFTEEEINRGGAISDDETPVIKEETLFAYNWLLRNNEAEPSVDLMEMIEKLDGKMNVCVAQNSKNKNFNQGLLSKGKLVNKTLKEYELDKACLELIEQYSRYRHALCMQFLIYAIDYFNAEKKKEKKLTNKDLLVLARDMIKHSNVARAFFSKKYTCFYIDEFQDTDPIQTELLFYLACKEEKLPDKWEDCKLKDGTLCMVGDPKQSIYAFTGADIKLYNRVKEKMERDSNSIVYGLRRNYRSNKKVSDWVENTFSKKISGFGFPDITETGSSQAIFEGMTTLTPEIITDDNNLNGVYRYELGEGTKDDLVKKDAAYIAHLVASLIENKAQISHYDTLNKTTSTRAVTPGDFLIITWYTTTMTQYIFELKEKGIPVSVAGRIETKALEEVNNLVLLLSYLDDYKNNYCLALVLEKLFACHLEEDKRFAYNNLIWNEEEIAALSEGRLKESLSYIRNLLLLIGQAPPMVMVETIVNDFKVIIANKKYDTITLNAAMGNVEQLLEVVRSESYSTFSDVVLRLKSLTEGNLDREMSITDLIEEDGEYNAVRIMNLHKAKGLEGNILILADPTTAVTGFQDTMVFIEEDGEKKGYLIPTHHYGRHVGKPDGWDHAKTAHQRLRNDEHLRLLYVASTRAKEAVIVASGDRVDARGRLSNNTAWKELENFTNCNDETKQICKGVLDYEAFVQNPMNTQTLHSEEWGIVDAHEDYQNHMKTMTGKIEQSKKPVANHVNPSKFMNHITKTGEESSDYTLGKHSFRGNLYGIIVHKFFQLLVDAGFSEIDQIKDAELEVMMKKSVLAGLESETLTERQCVFLNLDKDLEWASVIDQSKGIYDALHDDLMEKSTNLGNDKDFWELIKQADAVYTELPFQLMVNPSETSMLADLLILENEDNEKKTYIRGIMDLVVANGKNYTIIDYKTNVKGDGEDLAKFKENLNGIYKPQLDLYEVALKEMLGDVKVKSKIYTLYEERGKGTESIL